jgi:polyisoprenoid-binding protein YceI
MRAPEVPLEVEYGGRAKDPWGNERAGFEAHASIDQKDFGLQWNQLLGAGGVLGGERVDVGDASIPKLEVSPHVV